MTAKNVLFRTRFAVTVLLVFSSFLTRAQNVQKIDNWLDQNATEMGGRVMLMVYKDGKIIYSRSVNEMNRKQKMGNRFIARRQGREADLQDYTAFTRQPIASCSKWLSAALVMTFVDEGRLRLTDTVGAYLPVLAQNGKGGITIGQCLAHLTGIKAPPLRENLREMRNINSMDEAIAQIAALPMEGKPGKVFHYSNVGLQIAGAVLEKISGKSFQTLFAERIAVPLHMAHTDFGTANVPLPAGGAISTPEDYLNFLVMIQNRGMVNGKRILSEQSIREMEKDRLTPEVTIAYSPAEGGSYGYGYGEWIMEKEVHNYLPRTVSSPGLFGSFPWVDNEKGYCAFLMAFNLNNKGRQERYQQLKKLVDEVVK